MSRPAARPTPTRPPAVGAAATRAERRRLERERARERPRRRANAGPRGRRWPVPFLTGVALVAGLIAIVVLGSQGRAVPEGTLLAPTTTYPADLVAGETLGSPEAPVTLEVWSDFQCPFCGDLARGYLPRLVTDFVAGGQVRIVARDVDFVGRGTPNESVAAAVAASCAGDQGLYWQYHDYLFWNQAGENEGAFDEARLAQMADGLALDRGRWDACRADPARERAVATTTAAALAAGISSTPTLVLDGAAYPGLPRSYDDLAAAIRAILPVEPASTAP